MCIADSVTLTVTLCVCVCVCVQLQKAQSNHFDHHVHVEYEWRLRRDDLYDSDDDFEERVTTATICSLLYLILFSFLI